MAGLLGLVLLACCGLYKMSLKIMGSKKWVIGLGPNNKNKTKIVTKIKIR